MELILIKSYKQLFVEAYVNNMDISEEFTSFEVSHWIKEVHSQCVNSGEISWILSDMENIKSHKLTMKEQRDLCRYCDLIYRRVS